MKCLWSRCQVALAVVAMLAIVAPGLARAEAVALGVASTSAGHDVRTLEPVVSVRFTPPARQVFAEFTRKNVGRRVSLLVDGRVILTTIIREPIDGGVGQLSGNLTADQAKDLAARLSSGESKLEVVSAD